jgi:multidrug efflux pump subunit AcrA (membrane-fusion protein)
MKQLMQRKIVIWGFTFFLAFMGICTIVAKGIYAAGLPRVSTVFAKRAVLSKDVTFMGTVLSGEIYGIFELSGLRITSIFVKEGQSFSIGDPLFAIDIGDLAVLMAQKEAEIAALRGKQQDLDANKANTSTQAAVSRQRAEQEAAWAKQRNDLTVSRKRQLYEEAIQELSDYKEGIPDVSAGDAAVLERLDGLEDALRAASWELEDALLAQENGIVQEQWNIQDATSVPEGNRAESVANRLQLQAGQEELNQLKALQEAEGILYADDTGTVATIPLSIGDRTGDGACLFYYRQTGNQVLEAVLNPEEAQFIALGDVATLRLQHNDFSISEADEVLDFRQTDDAGQVILRWYLDTPDVLVGQQVKIYHPSQTSFYDTCLPRYCVYQDIAGSYVYLTEQRESILGIQWYGHKVYVNIIDEDSDSYAIECVSIGEDTQIIAQSDRELADGSPIRIVE